MSKSDYLRFTGDFNLSYVEILSTNRYVQNITKQVIGISIYEDVFTPFISGSVTLRDSTDLINTFPLIGEEILRLSVVTPSLDDKKSITGEFYIYKMTEREEITDKSIVYTLHFISKEAVVDLNKKISKTFEGKCSDIALKLITTTAGLNTDKKFVIEETPNGTKFISNFWSPVKNITYATTNAINRNGSPSFVFFENHFGFNFVSLEALYQNDPVTTFIYDNYANSEGKSNPEEMFKRPYEVSLPVTYDYITNLQNGMISSKLITYDLVTKKYTSRNYNMLDDFNKEKHLNKNPIVSERIIAKSSAAIIPAIKTWGNFNNYGDVTNYKTIQKRVSLLLQLQTSPVNIIVPGRTDYAAGQKIYLKMYKKNQTIAGTPSDSDIDTINSGYYIIGSIHHHFDLERHECYISLMRDSSTMNLTEGK